MKIKWKHLSLSIEQGHYIFKGQFTLAIPTSSMSLDKACAIAEKTIKKVVKKTAKKVVNSELLTKSTKSEVIKTDRFGYKLNSASNNSLENDSVGAYSLIIN